MKVAWRGVVDDEGDVVAWPMLLMDHNEAFCVLSCLRDYRARWRQWEPGGLIDFDCGVSDEDRALVEDWIAHVAEAERRARP